VADPLLGERLEAVERAVAQEAEILADLNRSRAQTDELLSALLTAHTRTLARLRRLTQTLRDAGADVSAPPGPDSTS